MREASEEVLKGKTLKVYWFLLKSAKPVRVSDIQHALGFSSVSLVQYHLNKLVDAGLVGEEQTGFVVKKVEVKNFIRFRGNLVPFQVAYVLFFSTTLAAMIALLFFMNRVTITSFDFLALVVNAVALAISVYETARVSRNLP
jgi:hypothetical protein